MDDVAGKAKPPRQTKQYSRSHGKSDTEEVSRSSNEHLKTQSQTSNEKWVQRISSRNQRPSAFQNLSMFQSDMPQAFRILQNDSDGHVGHVHKKQTVAILPDEALRIPNPN